MMNTGASKALQVTTPSDREIAMTRVFNAPAASFSTPGPSPNS